MHCLRELLVPWALKRLLFLYGQAGCTSTAADSAAVIESASWLMWLCLWWLFHWWCRIKWQTNQFLLLLQFLSVFRYLLGCIMFCENVHLFWADIILAAERVCTSALVAVTNCLTGFCEQLSPHYTLQMLHWFEICLARSLVCSGILW